jgi:DNA-binding HxlR family transcriptional regulator
MKRQFPKVFRCPTELTLDVLGGKWKTVILCFLKQRSCRYAELRKLMPNLSDKVLTDRLSGLVEAGLVVKKKKRRGLLTQRSMCSPVGHVPFTAYCTICTFGESLTQPNLVRRSRIL